MHPTVYYSTYSRPNRFYHIINLSLLVYQRILHAVHRITSFYSNTAKLDLKFLNTMLGHYDFLKLVWPAWKKSTSEENRSTSRAPELFMLLVYFTYKSTIHALTSKASVQLL